MYISRGVFLILEIFFQFNSVDYMIMCILSEIGNNIYWVVCHPVLMVRIAG